MLRARLAQARTTRQTPTGGYPHLREGGRVYLQNFQKIACVEYLTTASSNSMLDSVIEWKPIPSEPGCEASNDGRIRRGDRELRQANQNGYRVVRLQKRSRTVHRLVAEAFLGPAGPLNLVHHRDRQKANNAVENLEYVTPWEHCAYHPRKQWGRGWVVVTKPLKARIRAAAARAGTSLDNWTEAALEAALAADEGECYTKETSFVTNGVPKSADGDLAPPPQAASPASPEALASEATELDDLLDDILGDET